ncbi:MAG TPA: trehalose-6-phosphate synthase, partial [Thermoanaerobaculia bacterium]|nr:trehalose-6-phosphate synthase [Thermoanaerobaculia bacterium]
MSTTASVSAAVSEPRLSGPSQVSRPRGRCIVVSDRLPITLTREEGQGWRVAPAQGALISALTAVLGDRRGVWIGWPGVAQEETPGLRRVLAGAIHAGGFSLRPVMLTAQEKRNACGGFSGEVIWPLFHGLTAEHNFQPAYWQAFLKVNRKFARATVRTLARGNSANDLVWVHEPLLLNLAGELRRLKAGCRTAFFLHLPFPAPELYLRLPWREELLGGLLAFGQAGFQTELDLANFLACVRMLAPSVAVAPAGGGLWSLRGSWQGSAVDLR